MAFQRNFTSVHVSCCLHRATGGSGWCGMTGSCSACCSRCSACGRRSSEGDVFSERYQNCTVSVRSGFLQQSKQKQEQKFLDGVKVPENLLKVMPAFNCTAESRTTFCHHCHCFGSDLKNPPSPHTMVTYHSTNWPFGLLHFIKFRI